MNFVSSHWGTYKFSVDKNKKIQLDNWGLILLQQNLV